MNLFHSITLTLGVAAVMSLGTVSALAELKPGDAAPNFKLEASDGKTYSLSDFKGKKAVVLAWFPKAFTPGCTAECKNFHEHGDMIRKYDVAYFTISVDSVEGEKGNKKFAESLNVDFPILGDPSMETAKAYGVLSERKFANRWTYYIGKDGKILAIDKAVKPATSANDVANKLKELGVPEKK